MSATSHITLWCDFEECHAWTDHGRRDVRSTRALAKGEGWISRRGADFCCKSHAEGRLTHDEVLQANWMEKHRA